METHPNYFYTLYDIESSEVSDGFTSNDIRDNTSFSYLPPMEATITSRRPPIFLVLIIAKSNLIEPTTIPLSLIPFFIADKVSFTNFDNSSGFSDIAIILSLLNISFVKNNYDVTIAGESKMLKGFHHTNNMDAENNTK